MIIKVVKEEGIMVVGSIKKHNICIINKRRVERDNFGLGLEGVADISILKEKVKRTITNKGRVYGFYDKQKKLAAIYLFERADDFFVENGKSEIHIFGKTVDIGDKWFGESKAAYRYSECFLADISDEIKAEFEAAIEVDLKEQIEWGQIGGVEWDGRIIYRKNIDKSGGNGYWIGYILGAIVGFMFGWLLFDSIIFGLCFAASYALLGGIVFSPNSDDKDKWNTIDINTLSDAAKEMTKSDLDYNNIAQADMNKDFVNPKYKKDESESEE